MSTLAERQIGSQMTKTRQSLATRLSKWEIKNTHDMVVTLRAKLLADFICDYIADKLPAAKDFNANSALCLPTPEATAGIKSYILPEKINQIRSILSGPFHSRLYYRDHFTPIVPQKTSTCEGGDLSRGLNQRDGGRKTDMRQGSRGPSLRECRCIV